MIWSAITDTVFALACIVLLLIVCDIAAELLYKRQQRREDERRHRLWRQYESNRETLEILKRGDK